jgi:hypothetical protein
MSSAATFAARNSGTTASSTRPTATTAAAAGTGASRRQASGTVSAVPIRKTVAGFSQ